MYGRYNLNSLKGFINTINALHNKQTYFERTVKQKDFNFRKSDMGCVMAYIPSLVGMASVWAAIL